jgi:hypothetical protein
MDCNPGSHRPLEVQQPSSGQFPFTGLECDFFQLGGFQVQMAADHAAKSQRQRRGRGIDEADCSSLRHYSPNDRRKRADAQLWRLAFGVWRLAFNVRRQGVWREESGVGFRLVPEERRGRGASVGPRRSLRGGPNNQVCKDQFGRTALLRHPKVRLATYHSLVRNAASISAWIIFGLMALALSSCAGLSSTPGEPAHNRCSTPGSGDPE